MTTNPSFRYACDQARTYGSWRSQLMQVSVQKFTRTTRPRSAAGSSGSDPIHSVAPPSEGMCRRSGTVTQWRPARCKSSCNPLGAEGIGRRMTTRRAPPAKWNMDTAKRGNYESGSDYVLEYG